MPPESDPDVDEFGQNRTTRPPTKSRYTSEVIQITKPTLAATKPTRNTSRSRVHRWTDELDIRLLLIKFSGGEFFVKISLSEFCERVVPVTDCLKQSMLGEDAATLSGVVLVSVDVSTDHGRWNFSRVSDVLQDSVINGDHPVSTLSHTKEHRIRT